MFKNRPLMLLLTGLGLALALWLLVNVLQSGAATDTPKPSIENTVPGTINEDATIAPASILSVTQTGERYRLSGNGSAGGGLSLKAKEATLASTKIDKDGKWALGFTASSLAETTELDLVMATPDGRQIRSDQSLFIIANPHKTTTDEVEGNLLLSKSLILLSAPGAHSRVLQTPYENLPNKDGLVLESY